MDYEVAEFSNIDLKWK